MAIHQSTKKVVEYASALPFVTVSINNTSIRTLIGNCSLFSTVIKDVVDRLAFKFKGLGKILKMPYGKTTQGYEPRINMKCLQCRTEMHV